LAGRRWLEPRRPTYRARPFDGTTARRELAGWVLAGPRPSGTGASADLDAAGEQLAAVLRTWPVCEIERDVRLSGPQRVAFYELVTASLKAADTLGSACPAETALPRWKIRGLRFPAVRAQNRPL
jgi:hypothetical protein